MIGWKHSIDETGSYDGSSDAGIATFAGDPVTNFAREGIQNSLDAANRFEDGSKDKVVVELNLIKVDKKTIPGIDELEKNIKIAFKCFNQWFPDGDPKTVKFYKKLLNTLSKDQISVFQFKDANTRGMDYAKDVKDTRLFKFLKGKGISGKDAGSGGSFGIGKTASFAVSDIRTVFVSTAFEDNNNIQRLTQGKCQITSFEDSGTHYSGLGYWGEIEGCEPIITDTSVPSWMHFESNKYQTGTTLSVIGFNADFENLWEEKMTLSVAANYFAPIMNNGLEVIIGQKYLLNSKSLSEFLGNGRFVEKINKVGYLGNTHATQIHENTVNYLSAYTSNKSEEIYEECVDGVGLCRLKVRVQEGLPNKVCFLRDGIKITDELRTQGISRFVGFKDFVSVFECLDQNGNAILRSTENPSHNSFEPHRIESKVERFKAEKLIQTIGNWIREKLKESCTEEATNIRDIEVLLEFFNHSDENDNPEKDTDEDDNEINPFSDGEGVEFPVEPLDTENPDDQDDDNDDDNDDDDDDDDDDDGDDNDNDNDNDDGDDNLPKKRKAVDILNPRQIQIASNKLKIIFSTKVDADIYLSFYAVGEDLDERIFPKKLNGEKPRKESTVKVFKSQRNEIEIEFSETTNYALILKAYEIS